jgi:hypothetical protein
MTDEQRERKRAYLRDWYAKNRKRKIAAVGAWQRQNRDRANATKQAYVERDPARRKEQATRYAAKPEVRAKAADQPARKEWQKARNKRDAETLSDGFVRRIMAQYTSMKGSDLPQGLVDAYRELMKLKRLLNEKRG